MEPLQATIGSISRQMLQNFTKKAARNGVTFWQLRENIDWHHTLVNRTYQDCSLTPEAYTTVFKLLLEIYIADNREQAEDFLEEIEPYADLRDLTTWLHSDVRHIHYVSRALQEALPADGAVVLARAHQLYLQEMGLKLIEAISDYLAQTAVYQKSAG